MPHTWVRCLIPESGASYPSQVPHTWVRCLIPESGAPELVLGSHWPQLSVGWASVWCSVEAEPAVPGQSPHTSHPPAAGSGNLTETKSNQDIGENKIRISVFYTMQRHCYMYHVWVCGLRLRPKLRSVLLHNKRFSRYKVAENWKCTEWPQTELEHLTVKSTLYTLNTYPRGPNFDPFLSMTSHFWDTKGLQKSEMHQMTSKWTWTLNSQKYHVHTVNTSPWGPNYGLFLSTTSSFQDTRSPKMGNTPNDPKWTEHLHSKVLIYTI